MFFAISYKLLTLSDGILFRNNSQLELMKLLESLNGWHQVEILLA